jgi:branched-chain amino acid transport system permease protein
VATIAEPNGTGDGGPQHKGSGEPSTSSGQPGQVIRPRRGWWILWPGNGRATGLIPGLVVYLVIGVLVAHRGSGYWMNIFSLGAVNAVLAVGFSIVYSQAGVFSFATFGFYAIGGFSYAWFAKHTPAEVAMVLAIVVTAAVGLVVRVATTRMSKLYFAIASLAVGQLIIIVLQNWTGLSGGTSGIGPVKTMTLGVVSHHSVVGVYLVAWIFAGIAIMIGGLLYRSGWARDLLILRDLRLVGRNDGIAVRRLELEAFVVHAAFIGLAGALLADTNSFISTASFDVSVAVQVLIMVVLGGAGSVYGPVLGAAIVTALPEALRSAAKWSDFVFGILLLVIFVAIPDGITGLWMRVSSRFRTERWSDR